MHKIPFNRADIGSRDLALLSKSITDGHISGNGPFTKQAEAEISGVIGSHKTLLTTSCTHALEMSALLLNLKAGDEVIVPAFTFVSTASAFMLYGAKPVFVDILPDSWCIDPDKAEAAITPNTKAIVAVHLYGNLCNMDRLLAIGEKYGIPVIEDAAEAIGSVYHGKRAGSLGKFGAFSFHGTKTLTTGEGGMFVTNDAELYERVLTLSNHGRARGQTKQFWPEVVGFKYKMSNLQAAIGCAQMARIDELVGDKRRIFQYYQHSLTSRPLEMNPEPVDCVNGYWMPTLVVDYGVPFDREQLLGKFKAENIDARVFFWPLSMQPMFEEQRHNSVAFGIWPRALNLPSFHGLTSADMDRICNILLDFLT